MTNQQPAGQNKPVIDQQLLNYILNLISALSIMAANQTANHDCQPTQTTVFVF